MKNKMKYIEGQKLKVVTPPSNHLFEIGMVVTVEKVVDDGLFAGYICGNGKVSQMLFETDVEPHVEQETVIQNVDFEIEETPHPIPKNTVDWFWKYHAENPKMYELFKRFTAEVITAGKTNFSAEGIIERIRWETDVYGKGEEPLKINNNVKSFYARMWMNENPSHNGFFRLRKAVADGLFIKPTETNME